MGVFRLFVMRGACLEPDEGGIARQIGRVDPLFRFERSCSQRGDRKVSSFFLFEQSCFFHVVFCPADTAGKERIAAAGLQLLPFLWGEFESVGQFDDDILENMFLAVLNALQQRPHQRLVVWDHEDSIFGQK